MIPIESPAESPADTPAFTAEGYRIPRTGQTFSFPRNHGSHPDFLVEWWYLTGHLEDETGARHGFQLTFFRRALRPAPEQTVDSPAFGRDHLHMAHAAWTEIDEKRFTTEERLARNGWDAGASTLGLDLFQGEWRLAARSDAANPVFDAFFTVKNRYRALLTFEPRKPLVQFGEDGVERKGADPAAASHYFTWTRLDVRGTLEIEGKALRVRGQAWMDHEISSNQLDREQVGWDWASIQLRDGREIMMYLLRTRDGGISPFSVLYWVDRAGEVTQVQPGDFTWRPRRTWISPESGARYALDWVLELRDPQTETRTQFEIRPYMDAQEHTGVLSGIPYWEGACGVYQNGLPAGKAYVELTGYAEALGNQLRE